MVYTHHIDIMHVHTYLKKSGDTSKSSSNIIACLASLIQYINTYNALCIIIVTPCTMQLVKLTGNIVKSLSKLSL